MPRKINDLEAGTVAGSNPATPTNIINHLSQPPISLTPDWLKI
jgi:hypothetical protein